LCPPASTATVSVSRPDRRRRRCRARAPTRPQDPLCRARARDGRRASSRRPTRCGRPPPHHGPVHDGQMAAHRDRGRRVIDHPQAGRIAGLAERHEARARGPRRLVLALGLRPQADARRSARAAAAREVRERGERRLRATELIDQRAESPWPDILAANNIRRSQSSRSSSVNRTPSSVSSALTLPLDRPPAQNCSRPGRRQSELLSALKFGGGRRAADLALRAAKKTRDVRPMHDPQQQGERHEEDRRPLIGEEPQHRRHGGAGGETGER
jgi:hypothetical protein